MQTLAIDRFRFGVLVGKRKAEVHELPLPEMANDEVLVKQLACNICTADYTVWMGLRESITKYPMSGGHEGAGIIEVVGESVKYLVPGDFVALGNHFCGVCDMCKSGRTDECIVRTHYDEHGQYFGRMGFADYFIRPETAVIKMNPRLSPEEACFLEPVSTVIKGMRMAGVRPFDKVVVIGGGTMGQLNAYVAKAYGAKVLLSEFDDAKRQVAELAGIETMNPDKIDPVQCVRSWTGGTGADTAIVAVGSSKANAQAAAVLKKFDGKILLFAASYPPPDLSLTSNEIHYRRISLIGTYLSGIRDFMDAASMLNSGQINVLRLIEPKRYHLEHIQEAFTAASVPGKFRVSVTLNTR